MYQRDNLLNQPISRLTNFSSTKTEHETGESAVTVFYTAIVLMAVTLLKVVDPTAIGR